MKAPSVSVTALCVCLFYVGLLAELAHASKIDPYLNVLKTDPHLAHVAVREVKIWKWLAP
jgi:hypothetical protein